MHGIRYACHRCLSCKPTKSPSLEALYLLSISLPNDVATFLKFPYRNAKENSEFG